jgi:ATP-dependent Clp protease adapter protein ClpS
MQDVSAALAESVRLVFHSDDNTPVEFIVSLLQTVFAKSEREARHIVAELNEQGASTCALIQPRWRRHCSMSANGALVRPGIASA